MGIIDRLIFSYIAKVNSVQVEVKTSRLPANHNKHSKKTNVYLPGTMYGVVLGAGSQ